MKWTSLVLTAVTFTSTALAHGGAWNYSVEDVWYAGYRWWDDDRGQVSVQRRWPSRDPLSSYHPELPNPPDRFHPFHMACNIDGSPTTPSMYAKVVAGQTFNVHYEKNYLIPGDRGDDPDYSRWSHEWGPLLAYLAACGESCDDVDTTAPIWFKVHEVGLINGTWPNGYWGMMDLCKGEPFSIPIPKSLKPGKYILRHELIALHTPFQIFPGCVQIEVSGSGSALPGPDYSLVAFPGAYSENDPGLNITTEDFWSKNENNTVYPMPGPKVWNPDK